MEAAAMNALLGKQKAAHLRDGAPSAAQRIERIDRAIKLLIDNAGAIADALNQDFGSRSKEALKLSVWSPLAFSCSLRCVSRAMAQGSYCRFQWMACAPVSATSALRTLPDGPRRRMSLLPSFWRSLSNAARLW